MKPIVWSYSGPDVELEKEYSQNGIPKRHSYMTDEEMSKKLQ